MMVVIVRDADANEGASAYGPFETWGQADTFRTALVRKLVDMGAPIDEDMEPDVVTVANLHEPDVDLAVQVWDAGEMP